MIEIRPTREEVDAAYSVKPDTEAPTPEVVAMCARIERTMEVYLTNVAPEDAQSLAYWRGQFWQSTDGLLPITSGRELFQAQQNEIFPAVDSLTSALSLEVPQVEPMNPQIIAYRHVSRGLDPQHPARRVLAPLNLWAFDDELDDTIALAVLSAAVFARGGIIKTSWSPAHQRVIWRHLLPWEFFQDPDAANLRDARWAFDRFKLTIAELNERIQSNVYDMPTRAITADVMHRDFLTDNMSDGERKRMREAANTQEVELIEYWSFRDGKVYHVHVPTQQVLLEVDAPQSRPYRQLFFHPALGQPRQVSMLDILKPGQRDINALLSARRESIEVQVPRVGVNADLFTDDDQYQEFLNSSIRKPFRFRLTGKMRGESAFITTPRQDMGFDFNKHVQDTTEAGRYGVGVASMDRGQSVNIRTAEEASGIRQALSNRLAARMHQVKKMVRGIFESGLDCFRWAVMHPEASRIDIHELHEECVGDVDVHTWVSEIVKQRARIRVLPFSPAMEDKYARRANVRDVLVPLLNTPVGAAYDPLEIAREINELFGFSPATLNSPQLPATAPPPANAPPMGPLPPGGDPQMALAAAGGGDPMAAAAAPGGMPADMGALLAGMARGM